MPEAPSLVGDSNGVVLDQLPLSVSLAVKTEMRLTRRSERTRHNDSEARVLLWGATPVGGLLGGTIGGVLSVLIDWRLARRNQEDRSA
jgi:hypothetical protein